MYSQCAILLFDLPNKFGQGLAEIYQKILSLNAKEWWAVGELLAVNCRLPLIMS